MDVTDLDIPGVKLLRPRRYEDERGSFVESYSQRSLADVGITTAFVQDNDVVTHGFGVVRGLHFQIPPEEQHKLIRVVSGRIFDVVVDLRRGSPTFGTQLSVTLTADGGEQLFVPAGLAHGYCTLTETVHVIYKVSEFYAPVCEGGVAWDDIDLGIDWPVEPGAASLNERDRNWPRLSEFQTPFVWADGG